MSAARKPSAAPLSNLVPTNWCDSLLTGKDAALPMERAGKWTCRDIEALLRGIQDRIRAEEAARLAAGSRRRGK
jgi:hypothetical protein